ncbi:hypothetical protein TGMAS_243900 [Toxoplasma gondii MAS]|uniref:Uncharacterized protein n=1 Tax=Toxoplasma gondii MAS TaxID=943118 RepID=A0A086QNF6_TOXGO|nr:hypothetical protein TGMAS_243900 [Toxoplasma gondii MAS]
MFRKKHLFSSITGCHFQQTSCNLLLGVGNSFCTKGVCGTLEKPIVDASILPNSSTSVRQQGTGIWLRSRSLQLAQSREKVTRESKRRVCLSSSKQYLVSLKGWMCCCHRVVAGWLYVDIRCWKEGTPICSWEVSTR